MTNKEEDASGNTGLEIHDLHENKQICQGNNGEKKVVNHGIQTLTLDDDDDN